MIIDVPDKCLRGLSLTENDFRLDLAIGLYKRGEISLGRSAEIAQTTVQALQKELGKRLIPLNLNHQNLAEDLQGLEALDNLSASE